MTMPAAPWRELQYRGTRWEAGAGVLIAVIWSGVVSRGADGRQGGRRPARPAADERQGLDVTTHGENAYNS